MKKMEGQGERKWKKNSDKQETKEERVRGKKIGKNKNEGGGFEREIKIEGRHKRGKKQSFMGCDE